jgi:ribonuclease HI
LGGHAVLEYLLCNQHDIPTVLGQSKIPEMVAITCWYLWWERRQATHGESVKEPTQTAITIGVLYSNYVAAYSPKAKPRKATWEKPLQEFVKLNVDASFDMNELCGATGAVLRDSKGSFIAASSCKLEYVFDVLSAETLALKNGIMLAQSVGCNRLICCSDNLFVIEAMKGGFSSGAAAAILDDCYHLATEFSKIQFEHNYREANKVAHELARRARNGVQQVWLDEPPEFIVPLLVKDVTLVMNE